MLKRSMIAAALLSAVFSFANAANAANEAPSSEQCAEAFDASQRLSQSGKLQGALEQLIICAQPSCPAFLTRECTAEYERIQVSMPTVTLAATDEQGSPIVDVSVTVDGKRITDRIGGLATPVDPGFHEFVFERAGHPPVKVSVLISEGEKNKRVVAEFRPPTAPADVAPSPPVASSAPALPPPPSSSTRRSVPIATYVLGGVGIAAIGTGVAFRLIGASDYDALEKDCKSACNPDDVDPVRTKYTISKVSMGVGAAALVGAGVVFLIDRGSRSSETAKRPRLQALPVYLEGGGAAGMLEGTF
jgi:hypothetical protein